MAKSVLLLALAFLAFNSRYVAGRSLPKQKLKDHVIKKRSSYFQWQDTCPPPDFLSVADVTCKDTCHSNDDCVGSMLCCDNGCKMCLEPVIPPPVIDWVGSPSSYHRGFAVGGIPQRNHIDVDQTELHFEQVECAYRGKTYIRGETFLKGCHRCQCRIGGVSCEVGLCQIDKNGNHKEHSGEASGIDVAQLSHVQALELSGEDDDDENNLRVYPTKARRFESLELHREGEGERNVEMRIIPSPPNQIKPSGNGKQLEISNGWELDEFVPIKDEVLSGEVESINVLDQLTPSPETAEHSGYGFIEKRKIRRLPRLRRTARKQPQKDEMYKNVLMI